ncbi:hypothetical protein HYZ80_03970 [Candidatus Parcubacteria bacterium]|nr:hypothetical protein [Candidatus Parcubacteria bacterium]
MPASNLPATQSFLAFESIHDDVVAMKDGSLRAILMASSMNFELKSTEEQDAIVYAYQDFLNSLDFPIQFVVHSRRLDIEEYLEGIRALEKDQPNELLRLQTSEYVNFVKGFVELANIMSKTFYVVLPFVPVERTKASWSDRMLAAFRPRAALKAAGRFEEYRNQLWQRVEHVASGLSRFGVRAVALTTEELEELFYALYRPGEAAKAGLEALKQLEFKT